MYSVENQNLERAPQPVGKVRVEPVTEKTLPQIHAAAAADGGHAVLQPSHAVVKGDEVVGYGSLAVMPMMFAWLSTQRLTPRESFSAWKQGEALMAGKGTVCVPCGMDSPLLPFMEKMGYTKVGTAHIYLKEF